MPTLLLLFIHVVFGAIWAVIFQEASLSQVFVTATVGCNCETGIQSVDQVLSRGGMVSMETVIILVLIAGALGGSLKASGVLEALVNGMLRWVKRTGSMIALVLVSCYIVILFTGNQAPSLILVGQMFLPVFKKYKLYRYCRLESRIKLTILLLGCR